MHKLILIAILTFPLLGCIGPDRTVSLPMTVVRKSEETTVNSTKVCAIQFSWEHTDGWGNQLDTTEYKEDYCKYNVGDTIK